MQRKQYKISLYEYIGVPLNILISSLVKVLFISFGLLVWGFIGREDLFNQANSMSYFTFLAPLDTRINNLLSREISEQTFIEDNRFANGICASITLGILLGYYITTNTGWWGSFFLSPMAIVGLYHLFVEWRAKLEYNEYVSNK